MQSPGIRVHIFLSVCFLQVSSANAHTHSWVKRNGRFFTNKAISTFNWKQASIPIVTIYSSLLSDLYAVSESNSGLKETPTWTRFHESNTNTSTDGYILYFIPSYSHTHTHLWNQRPLSSGTGRSLPPWTSAPLSDPEPAAFWRAPWEEGRKWMFINLTYEVNKHRALCMKSKLTTFTFLKE